MVRFLHGGGVLSRDGFWRIDSNEPAATAAFNLQLCRGHPLVIFYTEQFDLERIVKDALVFRGSFPLLTA
jgi:hypothetical protein